MIHIECFSQQPIRQHSVVAFLFEVFFVCGGVGGGSLFGGGVCFFSRFGCLVFLGGEWVGE